MNESTLQAITQIQSLMTGNNNQNIAYQICLDVLNSTYQAKLPEKEQEIGILTQSKVALEAQVADLQAQIDELKPKDPVDPVDPVDPIDPITP